MQLAVFPAQLEVLHPGSLTLVRPHFDTTYAVPQVHRQLVLRVWAPPLLLR